MASQNTLQVTPPGTSTGSDADLVQVSRYLIPSGHKLYDFRKEPGFHSIAKQIIREARTLLDYNRLLVLWQAVRNTYRLDRMVAEVGVYQGGSTRFLAAAFKYWDRTPMIHAFDTFTGHPDLVVPAFDGPHKPGLFSETSYDQVQDYLSNFQNIVLHPGVFPETATSIKTDTFSLVHIDVDLRLAAIASLEFFWPRLIEQGVIVVDDYGFITCPGLNQAVDEFVSTHSDCAGWYVHTGQIVIEKRRVTNR